MYFHQQQKHVLTMIKRFRFTNTRRDLRTHTKEQSPDEFLS